MIDLLRYPRTPHLEGSRLQAGDSTDGQVTLVSLAGRGIQVWEEKLDGSNTAISFSPDAELLLQSRGHYLTGGWREKQFNLFKQWAMRHVEWLFDVIGSRYILYGEWMYAKHTVFYDRLSHYFFEFDVFDRERDFFLSTNARRRLLQGGDYSPIVSVPVLHVGEIRTVKQMLSLLRPSLYKSDDWVETLKRTAARYAIDPVKAEQETNPSDLAEGLYVKIEDEEQVLARYKYVRPGFLQTIEESGSHWNTRPILPNQLALGVDIFA